MNDNKSGLQNTEKAQAAINQIINLFRDPKNLAEKITFATINGYGKPSDSWSLNNRILQLLAGTDDGRTFEAWKKLKRFPNKGVKAFYILKPVFKYWRYKLPVEREIDGKIVTVEEEFKGKRLIGFEATPRFRYEDTTGEPLKEDKKEMPEPRLLDVAKELGLDVGYMNTNGWAWGWFSKDRKEIRLGTTDERVFFHELAHAIDYKFNADNWKHGQDPIQEITAEMSAAVLGMMFGMDVVKNHYDYIQSYAGKFGKVEEACLAVVARVEKVINFVLGIEKKKYEKEEEAAA